MRPRSIQNRTGDGRETGGFVQQFGLFVVDNGGIPVTWFVSASVGSRGGRQKQK
jgi:hypothetical protein